jgi:low affinity Fe/Cu permease
MVFLIQNTQNRDQMAMQVKLGELILAVSDADDKLAHAEDLTEAELEALHDDCRKRAEHVLGHLQRRQEAGHQKSSRRKRG